MLDLNAKKEENSRYFDFEETLGEENSNKFEFFSFLQVCGVGIFFNWNEFFPSFWVSWITTFF